ncbi:MAG: 2-C-methyl-D-erythritol 4-phosphate cytidylyltransferase [Verrucomicrobiota bacterium]
MAENKRAVLTAILVAAGSSRRVGYDKLFADLLGEPVIAYTISAFEKAGCVDEILIVAREDRHGELRKFGGAKTKAFVKGGEHRQDSVAAGLLALNADCDYVAVHDAARPLVRPEMIERVFAKAREVGAASAAEAVSDTLKRADVDLAVKESVDRHQLFAMQTPQIFERKLLEDAYRAVFAKNLHITDEVSAVQHLGHAVALVPNDDFNFKITYERDLKLAELVLRARG